MTDMEQSVEEPIVEKPKRKLINNLNDLTATEWLPETVSVFVQRGLGSNHADTKIEKQHPAPFSYQDVSRLIRFFTKKDQRVLDPFVGVGSTLKACAIEGRAGTGIELVPKFAQLSRERLLAEVEDASGQEVLEDNALEAIKQFEDDSFDFVVTSPPYWSILNKKLDHKSRERAINNLDTNYSNLEEDLANIADYDQFIRVLGDFFIDCSRILKPRKYMAIIVSDFRNKEKYYMFHSDLANHLEKGPYQLKGIKILYQRHKKIFPYGYPYSYVPNLHHQYIIILQNDKDTNAK